MNKNAKNIEKLQNKLNRLGFWRLAWYLPIKPVIVLAGLASIIAFPFNLAAGFVCLGVTAGALTINGINYAIHNKVDDAFYEKIRKTNEKINEIKAAEKDALMTYEEYKSKNPNVSTLVLNSPNGEKRVSAISWDKGPIVVDEEDKAFDTAIEIINSQKPKQEKASIAENASYLRENFNKISEEINNTL